MTTIDLQQPEALSHELYVPPAVVPPFAHKIGSLAAHEGFAQATQAVFAEAGISLEVEGSIDSAPGRGLLIAGDHRQRIEPLLVQGLMAHTGREASHVVAMPISAAGRIMGSSGDIGKGLIIPVIPRGYAAEYPLTHAKDVWRRARYPHAMNRPEADVMRINDRALEQATDKLAHGGAVTIFPTGGAADSAQGQWRRGIGQIAQGLSPDERKQVDVAVLRPDDFSMKGVLSALVLRDMGIRPKPQTITLRAHTVGSVHDLAKSVDESDPKAAKQFSGVIQDKYNEHFGA